MSDVVYIFHRPDGDVKLYDRFTGIHHTLLIHIFGHTLQNCPRDLWWGSEGDRLRRYSPSAAISLPGAVSLQLHAPDIPSGSDTVLLE